MKNDINKFIKELHERGYSLYDNKEEERKSLEELHERSYSILDEEGTYNLKVLYQEEFDKWSRIISFASQSHKVGNIIRPKAKSKKEPTVSIEELSENEQEKLKYIFNEGLNVKSNPDSIKTMPDSGCSTLEEPLNVFYLKRTEVQGHFCNATGHIDIDDKKFILHKGSYISRETSDNLAETTIGKVRNNLIINYCTLMPKCYRLNEDLMFYITGKSAAEVVLGFICNEDSTWKNSQGMTINTVLSLMK